jgi:hypothetical protein
VPGDERQGQRRPEGLAGDEIRRVKMTLNEIMSRYITEEGSVRKSVVFRIMKATMKRAALRFRDIIDLHMEKVSDVDPIWSEITYTYFYASKDEVFYARKSMLLLNYIAADYDGFSMDLVRQLLMEIDRSVENKEYSSMAKQMFLSCLGLNKKLPRDVKLWLKLN